MFLDRSYWVPDLQASLRKKGMLLQAPCLQLDRLVA
jgi:hypothetical protein